MTSAWIDNGPISLPRRPLAYGAGMVVVVFAVLGVGMGFEAASRREEAPGAASGQAAKDDAIVAKPIVDLAPPAAAPPANKVAADDSDKDDDDLAAKTAEAQAIQAKTSKSGDIDEVLASPTEKPPAPVKPATDEAAPGAPVKSDVPF
jgi:hypothetical protein